MPSGLLCHTQPNAKRQRQSASDDNSGGSSKKRFVPAGPKKDYELVQGVRGVLVTCDTHLEHAAIRECFQLFGELAGEPPVASGSRRHSSMAASSSWSFLQLFISIFSR